MKISIKYFAALAEKAHKTQETLEISDTSVEGLFMRLKEQYNFAHDFSEVRVAINRNYVDNNEQEIKEGDEVVFITHVAGG